MTQNFKKTAVLLVILSPVLVIIGVVYFSVWLLWATSYAAHLILKFMLDKINKLMIEKRKPKKTFTKCSCGCGNFLNEADVVYNPPPKPGQDRKLYKTSCLIRMSREKKEQQK